MADYFILMILDEKPGFLDGFVPSSCLFIYGLVEILNVWSREWISYKVCGLNYPLLVSHMLLLLQPIIDKHLYHLPHFAS